MFCLPFPSSLSLSPSLPALLPPLFGPHVHTSHIHTSHVHTFPCTSNLSLFPVTPLSLSLSLLLFSLLHYVSPMQLRLSPSVHMKTGPVLWHPSCNRGGFLLLLYRAKPTTIYYTPRERERERENGEERQSRLADQMSPLTASFRSGCA